MKTALVVSAFVVVIVVLAVYAWGDYHRPYQALPASADSTTYNRAKMPVIDTSYVESGPMVDLAQPVADALIRDIEAGRLSVEPWGGNGYIYVVRKNGLRWMIPDHVIIYCESDSIRYAYVGDHVERVNAAARKWANLMPAQQDIARLTRDP